MDWFYSSETRSAKKFTYNLMRQSSQMDRIHWMGGSIQLNWAIVADGLDWWINPTLRAILTNGLDWWINPTWLGNRRRWICGESRPPPVLSILSLLTNVIKGFWKWNADKFCDKEITKLEKSFLLDYRTGAHGITQTNLRLVVANERSRS